VRTPLNDLLGVEDDSPPERALPDALRTFASWDAFEEAVKAEAPRRRMDTDDVREMWLSALARIEVGGKRPREASDYMLLFETLRRAISQ
jgi:hypothetical protein